MVLFTCNEFNSDSGLYVNMDMNFEGVYAIISNKQGCRGFRVIDYIPTHAGAKFTLSLVLIENVYIFFA